MLHLKPLAKIQPRINETRIDKDISKDMCRGVVFGISYKVKKA